MKAIIEKTVTVNGAKSSPFSYFTAAESITITIKVLGVLVYKKTQLLSD
jgi:hypothetical protein